MPMQYLDLGKARFLSTKANLLAEIEASAALNCESGKHLNLRPSERGGELSVCEDLWICKSHDFRLSFVTSSDRDTKCATGIEETHLEEIENALQAAQLWKQLALQPSLLQQTSSTGRPFEASRRQFVLALRDDDTEQVQDESNGPETSTTKDAWANLRAPERVDTVQLVSVLISLRFEAIATKNGEESSTTGGSEPLTLTAALMKDEGQLQDDQSAVEGCSQHLESLLENNDFGPWSTLMDVDIPTNTTVTIRKSKRQSVSKAIIPLTDIAMRSLICPRPMRPPAAILPGEENDLFNLANLAPAVFLPGYRDVVQSRANLIPTIAKFLSKFLQHPGQKAQAKRRAREYNANLAERTGEEKDVLEQKETFKRHLWMTLVNGVKNVDPARKLKPLHIARTGGVQELTCTKFENLLDTCRPCEVDDTICALDDDFEDLRLDKEQDFNDLEDEYFSDLYEQVLSSSAARITNVTKVVDGPFNDEILEVLSGSPVPERMLDATLNLAGSTSQSEHANSSEYAAAATVPRRGSSSSCGIGKGFRASLDSSPSQLNEAAQSSISTCQRADVIGRIARSHAYVSRTYPSNTFDEDDSDNSSRAEPLLLDQFDLHAFEADLSVSPACNQPTTAEKQDIISINEAQHSTLLNTTHLESEMPSYDKTSRSSLTDVIGGDQLLWQMWTKRRPSMIQTDDDMLEMHAMYAQDPDMRLLETHKEIDNNVDDYMLESEPSNGSSINSASPTDRQPDFMFHYGPTPVTERKHHHPFHLHKEPSPAPSSQSDTSRPASRQKLSRGHSFLKRLSGTRTSIDESSNSSRPFSREDSRDIEIKKRKTLADYDKSSDGDDMLLN